MYFLLLHVSTMSKESRSRRPGGTFIHSSYIAWRLNKTSLSQAFPAARSGKRKHLANACVISLTGSCLNHTPSRLYFPNFISCCRCVGCSAAVKAERSSSVPSDSRLPGESSTTFPTKCFNLSSTCRQILQTIMKK